MKKKIQTQSEIVDIFQNSISINVITSYIGPVCSKFTIQ